MVHLYIMTRGQDDMVKRIIEDLKAQYFNYKISPHLETVPPIPFQMGVRPIQLWELAFPEDAMQEVLRMLEPIGDFTEPKYGCPSKIRKVMFYLVNVIKKFAKLDPVPKVILTDDKGQPIPKRIINPNARKFVDIKGIGVKKDKWVPMEMV